MADMIMGFAPTHPGEVLKAELEERGIKQMQLAENMGMSYKMLNDILNERRPITTETAMMFEAALDIPATVLLELQMKYNIHIAQKDEALLKKLSAIKKIAASIVL